MSILPEVIQHEGDNNALVYRYQCADLNTKSKLIVHETQEALFFKGGQALDLFPAGSHNLKTGNLPIIKSLFSKLYGGGVPLPIEVYFINKVSVLDTGWGTDAPISVMDPVYKVFVGVRANGSMGLRIKDSRKFVLRIAGQMQQFTVDDIRRAIKKEMISYIKETISQEITVAGKSVLEINSYLSQINDNITKTLNQKVDDIGLEINHFAVSAIDMSEEDKADLREAIKDIDQEKRKMEMLGYSYHDMRRYDIAETAAGNQGMAGGMMGVGMGLGMGGVLGGAVGQMMGNQFGQPVQQAQPVQQPVQPVQQPAQTNVACTACGAPIAAGSKFCPVCGQQQAQQVFCPNCGNKCAPGSKFCMNCGNKLA